MHTAKASPPSQLKIPLSSQQEFLCMFDKGDLVGPFGARYHIVDGWRISGAIDVAALEQALLDLVERHEQLRTRVHRDPDNRGQEILRATAPKLTVRDHPGLTPRERIEHTERLLNEREADLFEIGELPLLRAYLDRFDEHDSALVLDTHHSAADAWSMQVLSRDLAVLYARRRGHPELELPAAEQYRDFVAHQRDEAGSHHRARRYWAENLQGAEILTVETDFPTDPAASADPSFVTSWYRFAYPERIRTGTTSLSRATRSSPFMVLVAAFTVFMHRRSGATDIVTPTFSPGRAHPRTHNAVGTFFNFLPLRIDIAGCRTFRDVVALARKTCLAAHTHEVPLTAILDEAQDLMAPVTRPGRAPAVFQVVQSPFTLLREKIGDLEFAAVWRREVSAEVGSDVPDGMLWSFQFGPSDDLVGSVGYSRSLFTRNTIADLVSDFQEVLDELVRDPDRPLDLTSR